MVAGSRQVRRRILVLPGVWLAHYQWLDLEFAEPVPWLLISYSPREPDVCSGGGRVGQEDSWLVTDRRPKREASQAIQVDDESDFEEEDRMIE